MEYETIVGLSGDSVVRSRRRNPVGRSWSEHNVQALSGSARLQAQDQSLHPTHTKMPRPSHDREPPEQNRSTANAIHDSHDPKNGHDTGRLVANARRDPQITHARATLCGRSTGQPIEVMLMALDRGTLSRTDRRHDRDRGFRTCVLTHLAAASSGQERLHSPSSMEVATAVRRDRSRASRRHRGPNRLCRPASALRPGQPRTPP